MEYLAVKLVCCFSVVLAGKDTDEDLAHYIKKEPSTDMPWTSNERRINKMIEEEIDKFNLAPETTENPLDSQGRPRPMESRQPAWWNAYRQAKEGDRPDWSAEIRELVKKGGGTYPPWTPSQESEPLLSKYKDISPFTWRPGAPVINLRVKTDATTWSPTGTQEPTTERSIVLSSCHWDPSTGEGGGGGGKEPPLNLAPLRKGYKEDNEYLKVKPRRRLRSLNTKKKLEEINFENRESKLSSAISGEHYNTGDTKIKSLSDQGKLKKQIKVKRQRSHQPRYIQNHFAARV